MRPAIAAGLVILLPSFSASAGHAGRPFTVGAVVLRSASVRAATVSPGSARLFLAGDNVPLVSVDGGPSRLVSGPESPLPEGAAKVTVHY